MSKHQCDVFSFSFFFAKGHMESRRVQHKHSACSVFLKEEYAVQYQTHRRFASGYLEKYLLCLLTV